MSELTIIIPVYNEITTLPEIVERVAALPIDKDVIVVDNVSTDGTREWVQTLVGRPGIEVVLQAQNRGKGHSVRTGLARATGRYVVCQDADLEYDPEDLPRLLAAAGGRDLAVFGSRLLLDAPPVPWHHALGRDLLNLLFRVLYGGVLTDVATCYKLIPTAVAQSLTLRSNGFDLDYEIVCRLRRAHVAIVEIPVTYRPRTIDEGKKLRWTDGLRALQALLRYRVG